MVAAVRAQLPKSGGGDLNLIHRAWRDGPPREEVGLEPFAPPQYLTGQDRRP
ncbi:MAG TPA: hypothetical protein VH912_31885 [Streptosporangiaceae bacterium]